MGKVLQYSAYLAVRPNRAFQALLDDPRRVAIGFLGPLILAVVYFVGISVALATATANVPQFLVLSIPAERYYSVERFFIFPVGVAGTILTAGAVRLVGHWWKGQGRFEDLFALFGFSLVEVAVVIGLPDLVLSVLVGADVLAPPGFTFVGPHVWLGTAWYLLLMVFAVKEAERLPWAQSVTLALMGFLVNGAVQFLFIR